IARLPRRDRRIRGTRPCSRPGQLASYRRNCCGCCLGATKLGRTTHREAAERRTTDFLAGNPAFTLAFVLVTGSKSEYPPNLGYVKFDASPRKPANIRFTSEASPCQPQKTGRLKYASVQF